MPEITGANTPVGVKVSTTFGTASTITTGDKFIFESMTPDYGGEVLQANPLGTGDIMTQNAQKGAFSPKWSGTHLCGYNDPGWAIAGQFFGGCSVVQAGATGAYHHSILTNEIQNQRFVTVAAGIAGQSVMETASAVVTRLVISGSTPPAYTKMDFELLGNDLTTASTTNTWATVNAATLASANLSVFDPTSEFLINAQAGGTLTSPTDRVVCTGFTAEFLRPQQHAREAKGSAGNTVPIATNDIPLQVNLTVTFRGLQDSAYAYLAAYNAGTEYKASVTNTGAVISGIYSETLQLCLPRLKIVEPPTFSISNAGNNEFTVKFRSLVATSNPTGMIDVYPYIRLVNTRSTAYSV